MIGNDVGKDIRVVIEDSGNLARLLLPGTFDADSVTLDLLVGIAQSAGVEITVDTENILSEIISGYKDKPCDINAIIAEARPAVSGKDGYIRWAEGMNPDKPGNIPAASGKTNKIDYHATRGFVTISRGDCIGQYVEATEGEDGRDVTGRVIKATPGRKCPVKLDQSLILDAKNNIIAQENGLLILQNNSLSVSRLVEIKENVDFSTGNINIDGSVNIRAGVKDGFTVKATENITIDGLIESAEINCGGDLVCRRGMAARGKGSIKVFGNAEVGFLDDVNGFIKGNLTVHRELMNCRLVVGGDLFIENGSVIGGNIAVTGSISARELGSNAEAPTSIILGSVPILTAKTKSLRDKANCLRSQVEHKEAELAMLQSSMKHLSASEKERLTEINFEIDQQKQELNACEAQLNELNIRIEETRNINVTVSSVIHPRVCFIADGRHFIFEKPIKGPVHFGWDENKRLQFRIGDGRVQPISHVAREKFDSVEKNDDAANVKKCA